MERLAAGARERPDLPDLGEAPELRGITEWINSEPLTLRASRGQVVLGSGKACGSSGSTPPSSTSSATRRTCAQP